MHWLSKEVLEVWTRMPVAIWKRTRGVDRNSLIERVGTGKAKSQGQLPGFSLSNRLENGAIC